MGLWSNKSEAGTFTWFDIRPSQGWLKELVPVLLECLILTFIRNLLMLNVLVRARVPDDRVHSPLIQHRLQVMRHALGQAPKVISPFEGRYHASLAITVGY